MQNNFKLTAYEMRDLIRHNKNTVSEGEFVPENELRPLIYIDIAPKYHKYINWFYGD